MYDKKLFFGKANPLLAMEHLAATCSLSDLRHIFDESLDLYLKRALEQEWWPPQFPLDLHNRLKEVVAEHFAEEIYGAQLDLQSTLLQRCVKLYSKEVMLLVDIPSHVDKIKARVKDGATSKVDTD